MWGGLVVGDEGVQGGDEERRLDVVEDRVVGVGGEVEAEGDGGDGDEEAGERAHGSDDEEGGAGFDAGLEADDGAEAAGEGGGRQQVGEGGADFEGAAGEVVAELVREEDGDEGGGEGQAGGELVKVGEHPVKGEDVGVGGEGRLAERWKLYM